MNFTFKVTQGQIWDFCTGIVEYVLLYVAFNSCIVLNSSSKIMKHGRTWQEMAKWPSLESSFFNISALEHELEFRVCENIGL